METFAALFSESAFMPHGHCYLWTPSLLWLEVVTNAAIGLAYVAISVTLIRFMRGVEDVPLRFVYAAFGVFIVACGFTHFMDVWVIWEPRYWLDAGLRAVTAAASVGTAFMLPRFVPEALVLLRGAQRLRREGIALAAAMDDLSTMYARTRELDQLKTDFFANVSHELRTPLTLILAPIEQLMQRGDLPAEVVAKLELVRRNGQGLLTQVNDLLDVQKLDAGKLQPVFTPLDASQLVRGTAAQFDSLASERDIALRVDTPRPIPCLVDEEKIRRVCLNLLSNAFKHTPSGGTVAVQLELDDGQAGAQIVLRVADSGPGVAPKDRARIFERFAQGTSGKEPRSSGTGLGLAIVRELVELHGGRVAVRDAPDLGGALFEARIPLRKADVPLSPRAESSVAALAPLEPQVNTAAARPSDEWISATSAVDATGTRPVVVVAEDNDDLRALLESILSPRHRVLSARDGREALDLIRQSKPDLVISDVMMPRMTGEELVYAVRAASSPEELPMLLLTAKADEELRARILRSGAQDYLLKPFAPQELLARVQNLVAARRAYVLLKQEVEAQQGDVEVLSREVVSQKRRLESALVAMQQAREVAEQASRQKSDFLSLVSHELRTPIASIRLQLERLTRGLGGALNDRQSAIVGKISRSSARLLDLVESLLQFGRFEAGHLQVASSSIDVFGIVTEVVEELRPRADEKGLELTLEGPREGATLISDPQLVRLIVMNLCENAIKYTHTGRVAVILEPAASGSVIVRVTDTGPGIAEGEHQRVFMPFEQLEPVRHRQSEGVGLGLALVRRIAEALRAQVELKSQEGVGSTFCVTFHNARSEGSAH